MVTIIIIVVALIIIAMGVMNRKTLMFWIKAEVSEVIENNIDSLKIAKQRIKDLKAQRLILVDKAANILAEEDAQEKEYQSLVEKHSKAMILAKKAKEEDNKELSITKLKLAKNILIQIKSIEKNRSTLKATRIKLENINEDIKSKISNLNIQLSSLSARKQTNKVLSSLNIDSVNGSTITESLAEEDIKISAEEIKINYKIDNDSIEEEAEESSEEIEKAYEELNK